MFDNIISLSSDISNVKVNLASVILDKSGVMMVECEQYNIAVNGKSNGVQSFRESGSSAVSPGGVGAVKVRPGANLFE